MLTAAVAVIAAFLGWQWLPAGSEAQGGGQAAGAPDTAGKVPARDNRIKPLGTVPMDRQQQLVLWQQRYMRAEQTYHRYRDATRYPPDSRPLAEHPDQVRPFQPIVEDLPLRDASGKPAKSVRLRTSQERVFLAGTESTAFTIEAVDESGRAVPLVVDRSAAQTMPDSSTLITLIRANVPFTDNGAAPDEAAGDGKYSGRLTPAAQGFADYAGTIRLLVEVNAIGEKGLVAFDVIYAPAVPAAWAGVREALEEGSLNFYLKVLVKTPGRYVASGRVYDANGVPLALLQFNDVVPAGPAEFKLSLAGVLVRDRNPAFPLRLVDVEAFLLQPDTFPDRAMMPRLPGEAHVTQRYVIDSFSLAEWQSEERARYLAEYGRDLQQALNEMAKLRQR